MIAHEDLAALITAAATEVFETMLALTPHTEPAYTSTMSVSTNGVVSLIGLAGPWVGTGSISCTAHCATYIASQFMMSAYDAVNDEVLDAVAEVTNMIIGNVKTGLEEIIGPLGLSIPTVIYGLNFSSRSGGQQEWTVVPFVIGEEKLEIQVCLAINRGAGATGLAPARERSEMHVA